MVKCQGGLDNIAVFILKKSEKYCTILIIGKK